MLCLPSACVIRAKIVKLLSRLITIEVKAA